MLKFPVKSYFTKKSNFKLFHFLPKTENLDVGPKIWKFMKNVHFLKKVKRESETINHWLEDNKKVFWKLPITIFFFLRKKQKESSWKKIIIREDPTWFSFFDRSKLSNKILFLLFFDSRLSSRQFGIPECSDGRTFLTWDKSSLGPSLKS